MNLTFSNSLFAVLITLFIAIGAGIRWYIERKDRINLASLKEHTEYRKEINDMNKDLYSLRATTLILSELIHDIIISLNIMLESETNIETKTHIIAIKKDIKKTLQELKNGKDDSND